MIRGMMIRMALTRNGNPGKPKLDDRMYIGLKIKAPIKLQNVSTVVTEENMAPTEQEKKQYNSNKIDKTDVIKGRRTRVSRQRNPRPPPPTPTILPSHHRIYISKLQ